MKQKTKGRKSFREIEYDEEAEKVVAPSKPKKEVNFKINVPFEWNEKQKEIIVRSLKKDTKCVIIDSFAGCGKNTISTFCALTKLQKKQISKIYYVRSIVESSTTKMGMLPGGIAEKYEPHVMAMRDSLAKLLTKEDTDNLLKSGVIEFLPFSYIRGRNLDDCVIILDENQNLYVSETLTVMTRLCENATIFILADSDQCDLPKQGQQEFAKIVKLFGNKEDEAHGIYYYELRDEKYVMRSEFVKYISNKYREFKKQSISFDKKPVLISETWVPE
jgi:phosphate starvation-inducible PhoH-like protein